MTDQELQFLPAGIAIDDDIQDVFNQLTADIEDLLRFAYIYDWKNISEAELKFLDDSLHLEVMRIINKVSTSFCRELKIIHNEGAWGCTISVHSYLRVFVSPVVPWTIRRAKSTNKEDCGVKFLGLCSVIRESKRIYKTWPRGSQMFIDINHVNKLVGGTCSDLETVMRNSLICLKPTKRSNSGYYANIPSISGEICETNCGISIIKNDKTPEESK